MTSSQADDAALIVMPALSKFSPPDSYVADLAATATGRRYRLFISGRNIGERSGAPRDVILILDGNWLFASLTEFLRTLSLFDRSIGWPVVVGVGYPTDDDGLIVRLRDDDLAVAGSSPGPRAFADFISDQIWTYLRESAGLIPRRSIIAGHSWGGSFALFALMKTSLEFDGYLASSPPILGTALDPIANTVASLRLNRETKLFFSHGADEAQQFPDVCKGVPLLARALEEHGPMNLRNTCAVFDGETHSSVFMAAMAKGVRYLLAP